MSENPFEGLVGSRQDRPRYPDRATGSPMPSGVEHVDPGGNERMLHEDLRLHALPYRSGNERSFDVEIHPLGKDLLALVSNALPVRSYRHWQLEESVRDYVQSALGSLAQGDLYLEIEYFWKPDGRADPPVAFAINVLYPERVTRRFGKFQYLVQIEPQDEAERWAREPIDPRSLVVVSIPNALRRQLNRTLRIVRAADQDLRVMSDFVVGADGRNSGFDFGAYQRMSHDIVLRASRATGWTGRGIFADGLLDPEKVWRAIQFARLTVKLRDAALEGLQTAIDRAGVEMGFAADIKLSRVLTLSDLEEMKRELEAGTRPIKDMSVPKPPSS